MQQTSKVVVRNGRTLPVVLDTKIEDEEWRRFLFVLKNSGNLDVGGLI